MGVALTSLISVPMPVITNQLSSSTVLVSLTNRSILTGEKQRSVDDLAKIVDIFSLSSSGSYSCGKS